MSKSAPSAWLRVRDVVRLTRVSDTTVRGDIAAGILPATRLPNGQLRIARRDLDGYRGYDPETELLTVREAGLRVNLPARAIRRAIAAGALKASKLTRGRVCVTATALEEWLDTAGHPHVRSK
jgi:excisionase family DNA binding protein